MKTKILLLLMSVLFFTPKLKAQQGIEQILFAGLADANELSNVYVNPAMKGFISSMNNGWYHTAKVHKVLGFDITIGASGSIVSPQDESFNFSDLRLSGLITNSPISSPTLAGSSVPASDVITVTVPANTFSDVNGGVHPQLSSTFRMPDGFKEDLPINIVPAPSIQVGVGLPYDSEVIVRYFPKTETADLKAGLFGIGFKKEITEWFGPIDKLPLHVSLLATYSRMNLNHIINSSVIPGNGQIAEFALRTFSFDAIASLNFPFINVFGGFGYGSGTTNLNLLGTYALEYNTGLPAPFNTITRNLKDPISLKSSMGGMKANIGARLSLGFFKVFASYTLQEYNTINAGIALSVR